MSDNIGPRIDKDACYSCCPTGDLPVLMKDAADNGSLIEAELREINRRYQRLIDAVTDYIYTVTVSEGKAVATTHSHACICLTGYTPTDYEVDPMLWYRMVHEADRDAVRSQADQVLSGRTASPLEHRIYHKNGSIRWVKNMVVPHYDSKNRLVEYDGLVKDITERKCLEEQLYHAQKMQAVGTLAGGLAHDFRNYLSTIIGYAELSLPVLDPEEKLYRYMKIIHETSLKATDTTHKLLTFSRKQAIEPKLVELDPFIRSTGRMLHPLFGNSIDLSLLIARDAGWIKIEPAHLEQIILNLAVNAKDAMPQGGFFTIEARKAVISDTECSYRSLPAGRYALISFRDSGAGMSEDVKQRIFEPFFTTKEAGKGTGLGLSSVYGVIEQNNGAIRVESKPNCGTTFYVYLPSAYDPACQDETGMSA